MSLCINPQCPNPQNPDNVLFCYACNAELLFQGRYRAVRVVGGGGFGKTYEVKEGTTSKVLKVLINTSPKAVELFQKEAKVLSQLVHPGIPRVESNSYFTHPISSQQSVHCLMMEKIDGENLREYIKRRGRPIDGEVATRWLTELVLILQQVHNQGILHRDIKPQNIILKPDGRLALIDFGAVREGTGTEVATAATGSGGGTEVATQAAGGTSISSTGYTPIEQINGQAVPQSDFFALGRTFVFLLTGKEPNNKAIYDTFNDELKWRGYASGVSSQLADLIDHMAARLPRQRPINAQSILQALQTGETASQSSSHEVQPVPGEDIEIELRITAQEAASGISKAVTFSRMIYPGGVKSFRRQETKTLTVNVPPNSQNGTCLRLAGQGNEGLNGSSPDDIYVQPGDVLVRLIVNYSPPPPLSEFVAEPPPPKKNQAGAIIGGVIVFITVAGVGISLVNSGKNSLPVPKISSKDCLATVLPGSGNNVRTLPEEGADRISQYSEQNDEQRFDVTGKKAGNWIELNLPNNSSGWAHISVIKEFDSLESCLSAKGTSLQTIEKSSIPGWSAWIDKHTPEEPIRVPRKAPIQPPIDTPAPVLKNQPMSPQPEIIVTPAIVPKNQPMPSQPKIIVTPAIVPKNQPIPSQPKIIVTPVPVPTTVHTP